jgi:DNA-binding MarR family transcriptional regulator
MFREMPRESIYEFARQAIPCVGFNTRRATRLITQYYDRILAPTGLRSTQYSLLNGLSMMGESSMQDLAFILAMDRTTLTRNLSPLQKKGLVKVSVGNDRRSRQLMVTSKGRIALEKALPYWQKAQSHIVDTLGAEQWDTMMRGLHQISLIVEENS